VRDFFVTRGASELENRPRINSTSKIRAAFGGVIPPAPCRHGGVRIGCAAPKVFPGHRREGRPPLAKFSATVTEPSLENDAKRGTKNSMMSYIAALPGVA
jgi:hypothetical protein